MDRVVVHSLHMVQAVCDVTRVQSAAEWTASVHSSHMSQSYDVTCVQSATEWLLSCILHYDVTCVQSATEWTASYILYTCPKAVM